MKKEWVNEDKAPLTVPGMQQVLINKNYQNSLTTQNHGSFTFKFEDHLVPKSSSYQELCTSFRVYVPYSQQICTYSIQHFDTGGQVIQYLCLPVTALHTLLCLYPAPEPMLLTKAYLSNICGTGNQATQP